MKLIVFDCDSTLSSIEGIDELARLRGEETFAEIEALTRQKRGLMQKLLTGEWRVSP